MKNNLSEKILRAVTILLILLVFLLSLTFPRQNRIYLFLLVFGFFFWQRKWLQTFFQKLKNPKIALAVFLFTGWLGALFLEFCWGRLPFSPRPITNLIIGLGFYLPYFCLWRKFVDKYKFNFLEIFYLSGLGKLLFDGFITHKLFAATGMIAFITRVVATIVLFGSLTTLPIFLIGEQKSNYHKPTKEYFMGILPTFLAVAAFIAWVIILKIIFHKT